MHYAEKQFVLMRAFSCHFLVAVLLLRLIRPVWFVITSTGKRELVILYFIGL